MRVTLLTLVAFAWAVSTMAQGPLPTEEVFRQFSDRVVKIEIQEIGSAAKASIGSGFMVSDRGHLVTNYHVVAKVVNQPERYDARYIGADDEEVPVVVLAVDVAHDLAVVKADRATPSYFALAPVDTPQGLRIYSLGHPLDLGLNIVEGTYNGFLKHAFDKRINFTGSLNPGMSGGPAITADGLVAGINVASSGEQVSFLVPVQWAIELYQATQSGSFERPESFLDIVRDQIVARQEELVATLIARPAESVDLGGVSVPTEPATYFNCWADAYREDDVPYETVDHSCSTDDYIFLSDELVSGQLWFYHRSLESDELNRFQFASLFTSEFHQTYHGLGGGENEVTEFRCHADTVARSELRLKTIFCLRGYRKLEGLYDVVLKAATIGRPVSGLETVLVASGVTFENARALSEWYLEQISWAE